MHFSPSLQRHLEVCRSDFVCLSLRCLSAQTGAPPTLNPQFHNHDGLSISVSEALPTGTGSHANTSRVVLEPCDRIREACSPQQMQLYAENHASQARRLLPPDFQAGRSTRQMTGGTRKFPRTIATNSGTGTRRASRSHFSTNCPYFSPTDFFRRFSEDKCRGSVLRQSAQGLL